MDLISLMCIKLSYESFGKLCFSRNLFISSKFKYKVVYKILFLVSAILMSSFIYFVPSFFLITLTTDLSVLLVFKKKSAFEFVDHLLAYACILFHCLLFFLTTSFGFNLLFF